MFKNDSPVAVPVECDRKQRQLESPVPRRCVTTRIRRSRTSNAGRRPGLLTATYLCERASAWADGYSYGRILYTTLKQPKTWEIQQLALALCWSWCITISSSCMFFFACVQLICNKNWMVGSSVCTWHALTYSRFGMYLLLGKLIETLKGLRISECAWACVRKYDCSWGCCSLQTDAINTQTLALARFVSKTLQSHTKLGRYLFLFFREDSKKLICNPDTNKQLMHKYAHNFKTKGEQLYLCCKGGRFLSLSKQHRARLKSQNPPHVWAVCAFAPACLPPDVLFPSPACCSSLSL